MLDRLSRHWWILALRGALSIAFGVVAFVMPGVTLAVLVIFLGAYMLVDGIFAFASALRFRHERERWPALLLEGVLGVLAGILTFAWPAITMLVLLALIAVWAIVTGILEIAAAVRLRREIRGEWLLALSGIASIAFGVAVVVLPLVGLLVSIWIIGAYAIVFGALLVSSLSFRLRGIAGKEDRPTPSAIVSSTTPLSEISKAPFSRRARAGADAAMPPGNDPTTFRGIRQRLHLALYARLSAGAV